MAKVVVGMSGGVDSSVAAYLMKQQGHEVIGLFMKNWHDESVTISKECPWVEDSNDALIVAQQLGIPFQTLDLSASYRDRIVNYMFAEYKAGRTPNPDVLCNREIKFDVFLQHALNLGADYVATGHYCRKETIEINGKTVYRLLAGKDDNKDQSYFLCQVDQQQLSKALFPIGELEKPEVRAIASKMGLATAGKKDSQGLCFVGKVRLPDFLQQQLQPKEGKVYLVEEDHPSILNHKDYFSRNLNEEQLAVISREYDFKPEDGREIGKHNGAHFYTIGQRKGLGIGGFEKPLFIIGTDTVENTIYTAHGEEHPGLYRPALFIPSEDVHWVRDDLTLKVGETLTCKARIRYRQPLEDAKLYRAENGLYIVFDKWQRGIASGQFAAWYDKDELLGSGVIS
ncbi:MAG: tRNA 2-thiouridine(34) synthase MnmA [Bacteroidetes bacterium]|nr:tRNA 2-thiouridine(34) synthase MnmA [Bacteroidota bacterium]